MHTILYVTKEKVITRKWWCPVFILVCLFYISGCGKNKLDKTTPAPPLPEGELGQSDVGFWLTRADNFVLFKKQNTGLAFVNTTNSNPTIVIDSTVSYQSIDGFGAALTQGSAYLINRLPEADKDALLTELFSADSTFIGISYLRVSIGASDLSTRVYFYDDMPPGQTDSMLASFSLGEDLKDLVPVLQRIVAINPGIKILASPWSAPVWMKTNNSSIGGNLKPAYYDVYAKYFVKYIQAMKELGIRIDAVTIQNEPLNPYNNPSMLMQASEQKEFLKDHLGPAFEVSAVNTKIILNENNPDVTDYPLSILQDPDAAKYADGSAFHLYGGDINSLTTVHNAYPDKNIYFTEQWVGAPGDFNAYLQSHIKLLIIGAVRNWSKNVLEWNLASDPGYQPHTTGGCNLCLGTVTIGPANTVTRNVGYYILAHAAKFVRPGSVRIFSTIVNGLPNVAFCRPDGKKVLIVMNESQQTQDFNIQFGNRIVSPSLAAGSVGTFIW